jgi:hypothetical protein
MSAAYRNRPAAGAIAFLVASSLTVSACAQVAVGVGAASVLAGGAMVLTDDCGDDDIRGAPCFGGLGVLLVLIGLVVGIPGVVAVSD